MEFYMIGAYLKCTGCPEAPGYEDCHTDCCLKCHARSLCVDIKDDGSYDVGFTCIFSRPLTPRPRKVCSEYLDTTREDFYD